MLGAHCCEMFATDSCVTNIKRKIQKTKEKDKGKIIEV